MHNKLQITYENNKPYGIRDEHGYLFFFTKVSKYPNQEERYRKELEEQFALADYLLAALKERGLTTLAVDERNKSENIDTSVAFGG
jgi:uncharacterized protein YeaO (DUF488 family)